METTVEVNADNNRTGSRVAACNPGCGCQALPRRASPAPTKYGRSGRAAKPRPPEISPVVALRHAEVHQLLQEPIGRRLRQLGLASDFRQPGPHLYLSQHAQHPKSSLEHTAPNEIPRRSQPADYLTEFWVGP